MPTDEYRHRRNELNRQAREFLRTILAEGPQPYSTIIARATETGISLDCLFRAKRALGIRSRLVNNRAVWALPPAI